jgi:hypothetical protein
VPGRGFWTLTVAQAPPYHAWLAPGNEFEQYHNNGNRQQEVDEPAQRVTAYETEQPQNEQYERNYADVLQ